MKITIVHNHPIHYKHLLFLEMKKGQFDIEVFFVAGQSSIRHEDLPLAQDRYRYRIGFDGPYESAPAKARALFTWKAVSESSPDILIISGYYAIECWSAWLWARLNRRPIVLWYESNEFDYKRVWYKELPKRLFIRHCDRAHVYGRSHKAYLVKLGMPEHNIVLKRSVANVDAFSTAAKSRSYSGQGCRHLVYVGRLAPEKNVSTLLRALAAANNTTEQPKLRLSIVGTGPLEQDLKQECKRLGIQSVVTFKGYCPQSQLPELLRTADFFILPSMREPWGLVALEAMLCRVPVLISTQCGCAEDVVTPDTGWKFSPWSVAELASILIRLPGISDERLAIMGEACHRVASVHTAKGCAQRVCASLRELAEARQIGLPSGKADYAI